jgi:mRNA interferase MazF
MLNVRKKNERETKNFKELAILVEKAVGHNTIREFAYYCGIPNLAKRIADIIHERISTYPEVGLLQKIANGSQFRVSFDELRIACGYSLNDGEINLKDIKVLRGNIYLCDMGNYIDSVQGGVRPVLIIQNNIGNQHATITMAVPISSKISKNNMPTHIKIGRECGLERESELLIEQMRVISKRNLMVDGFVQFLCECPENILRKVEIAIMKQTGMVNTRANESTVDRFLERLNEYVNKVENSYNNYNQNNSRYVEPRKVAVCV